MRTFGELKDQLEMEMDTQDETFIQSDELKNYFNTAVTLCESEIVKLGLREKYLQKEFYLSTVAGQSDYDLPDDIVANKIRKVIYRHGTLIHKISPAKSEDSYEVEDLLKINPSQEIYQYMVMKSGENNVFRLLPRAALDVTDGVRIIYFAKLNRFDDDDTNCDLPDICYEFILSYVRYRVYMKENNERGAAERADMNALLMLVRETLQNQVADPEMDEMDSDTSHYEEFS